jgi:predicted  nucleic acid-binding Zn-ribbon protein
MNETIAALLKLQEMDLALGDLRRAKTALGPRRDEVKEGLRRLLAAFEDGKKSLTEALSQKKSLELEAESKDQAVRKHTAELNSVKSNDAYKALLTQIEAAKQEKSSIEDRILEVMSSIEALQKESKEREKTLAADKASFESRAAAVEDDERRLEGDLAGKTAERDSFAASLPEEARRRYDTVRRGRAEFSALAEVRGMICLGCRTTLPPDVVNNVMKGKQMLLCETCSRILYILPAPAPAAPPAAPTQA